MSDCVECGRDVLCLDDVGLGPNVCGWCKKLMCPLCKEHTACAGQIASHNKRIDLKEAESRLSAAEQEVASIRRELAELEYKQAPTPTGSDEQSAPEPEDKNCPPPTAGCEGGR